MIKKNSIWREIKSYAIITFALFIMALGLTAFLIPSKIVGGGVNGISTLIYFATGIPVGISVLIINGILVLIALKVLGKGFGIKTVYSIAMVSLFISLLQYYIKDPWVQDKFLAAIIGGGLIGASIGMAFMQGGSTGGTDIVAMIINKYRTISPGRIIMYIDIFIIASSYLIFRSIEIIVYGYVVMGVCSYVIDMLLTGAKQSVQMLVFSQKPDVIAERIGTEVQRGVTFIKGRGWYSKAEGDIVMVITKKTEYPRIFHIIKEEDPNAFITINNVTGVYGKGFDMLKKA